MNEMPSETQNCPSCRKKMSVRRQARRDTVFPSQMDWWWWCSDCRYPSEPTMIDLDKLEQLARDSTPGPWSVYAGTDDEGEITTTLLNATGDQLVDVEHTTIWDAGISVVAFKPPDAAYIAAASPDVVLELIAELRRLRAAPPFMWSDTAPQPEYEQGPRQPDPCGNERVMENIGDMTSWASALEARVAALEAAQTPVEATPVESERERNGRLLFEANASLMMHNCPEWETQIRQVQEQYCEFADRYNKTAGLVSLAEVKAVLECARDAYSDHPGLSDRPEFQHATQVVTSEFFEDLMTALETRFGEGKP